MAAVDHTGRQPGRRAACGGLRRLARLARLASDHAQTIGRTAWASCLDRSQAGRRHGMAHDGGRPGFEIGVFEIEIEIEIGVFELCDGVFESTVSSSGRAWKLKAVSRSLIFFSIVGLLDLDRPPSTLGRCDRSSRPCQSLSTSKPSRRLTVLTITVLTIMVLTIMVVRHAV